MTAIFWSTLSLSSAGLVFRAVACGFALDIPRRGFDPGGGGDEEAWNTLGRAAQILDNLIAEGKAKPMIVVMPNGNTNQRAYSEAAPGMNDYAKGEKALGKEVASMEESFPDIIKFVESNYRTLNGLPLRSQQSQPRLPRRKGLPIRIYGNPRWPHLEKLAYLPDPLRLRNLPKVKHERRFLPGSLSGSPPDSLRGSGFGSPRGSPHGIPALSWGWGITC